MTDYQKLAMLKTLMGDGGALPSDETLTAYLDLAKIEILEWLYHQIGGVPDDVTTVPAKYEPTQIYAVVAGYTHAGAEGQTDHNENGITRKFRFTDMLDYIHQNVVAFARVGAVT